MVAWDEAKRQENLLKHGVDLALVERFDHVTADIVEDRSEAYGEQRERALGLIDGKVYVYVYTPRGDDERAISLRHATLKERGAYEKQE